MEFRNHYEKHPKLFDRGGGQIMVERAGYISSKQRIENLILAGQRLVQYREDRYDTTGNETEAELDAIQPDPTRRVGYDRADATQQMLQIQERIKKGKPETVQKQKEVQEKPPEEGGEAI